VGAHAGGGFPFVLLIDGDGRRRVYLETITDGVLVDDAERFVRCDTAMQEMTSVAMSLEESVSLLDTVALQL
jgi:hypothetical protein